MKLFKLLPVLLTLAFISCSPQPALAAIDFYQSYPDSYQSE